MDDDLPASVYNAAMISQLRAELDAAGISGKEAASRLGYDENTVLRYLNGKTAPKVDRLLSLVALLPITQQTFFDRALERARSSRA